MARVLVVDDTPSALELASLIVGGAGYEVDRASSGREALARFEERRPDLVLLDVMMPGLDGMETCRRIRALDPEAEVPVVFLTALDDQETHHRAQSVGADDFLVKPIRKAELLIRLRSLLRIRELNRRQREQVGLIRRQRDELARTGAARDLLMRLFVHDMKNVLQGAVAFSELAQLVSPEGAHVDHLRRVDRSISDLLRMQTNMLVVASGDAGELEPHPEQVDLEQIVRHVVGSVEALAAERDTRVRAEAERGLALRADPDLLRRLLDNLVHNALAHAPNGGWVAVEARRTDEGVLLLVEDDGDGVPEGERERIFELYQRGGHARGLGHHGLGLAFCRMVAEAHGGGVIVTDGSEGGARFEVRLPAG